MKLGECEGREGGQVNALSPCLSVHGFEQIHTDLSRLVIQIVPPAIRQPAIIHDDPAVDHDHGHIGAARGMN